MTEVVERGRDAVQAHRWEEAVAALTEADAEVRLAAGDLHLLADAAWWAGDYDLAVDSFERAFGAYRDDGDTAGAAQMALWLAYISLRSRQPTVAKAWLAKADKLLAELPEQGTHAWLELLEGASALMVDNDTSAGFDHIEAAIGMAERHGNTGVLSLAQSFKGMGLIFSGTWREGLSLIDSAAAEAMATGTDLRATSDVYCNTIAACRDVGDFRRAGEWTERAERWMQRQSVKGYPGICRVHRAELKRHHGSWDEAEEEARDACKELERFHLLDAVGFAHYEIGEIRRRRGDYAGAEASFMQAYEYGYMPQPGLALLMLARGEIEEAARSLERVLSQEILDAMLPAKAVLLPAMARVALAEGKIDTAREALATLEQLSGVYDSPALIAAAETTAGRVALESGELPEAASALETAWRRWRDIDFPYEMAEARCLLGKTYAAQGDLTGARMEWSAAGTTFQRLGATPGMAEVESLRREHGLGAGAAASQRVERTFMFTDIVSSTEIVEVIGDAAWDNILTWHDRTLRQIFIDHHGEEVKQTGDGFFVSFGSAEDAVTAAVEVQRRLSRHRQDHGFAPWVRIGIHSSEATLVADDYRGQGVHVAARVGDLGGKDEIVATTTTVDGISLPGVTLGDPRPVELKGIADVVEIVPIEWA